MSQMRLMHKGQARQVGFVEGSLRLKMMRQRKSSLHFRAKVGQCSQVMPHILPHRLLLVLLLHLKPRFFFVQAALSHSAPKPLTQKTEMGCPTVQVQVTPCKSQHFPIFPPARNAARQGRDRV